MQGKKEESKFAIYTHIYTHIYISYEYNYEFAIYTHIYTHIYAYIQGKKEENKFADICMPEVKALTNNLKGRSGSANAHLVARELEVCIHTHTL